MNNFDVSVIIPCYNCENTITKCIESVINQTMGFKNIELILVDDKSKDNTKNIIKKYSEKYENIKPIFLKENSGYPGKPRNIGIQNATADYIMFMDNDDEYDHEICEKLYKEIKQKSVDLTTCNYINTDSFGSYKCEIDFKNGKELDYKIIIENNNVKYFRIGVIWCNIFKKSIIYDNKICFPENKLYEDGYFMTKYLLHSKKVVYLNKYYGYLRNIRENSTIHSMNIKQFNGLWDVLNETIDLFPQNHDAAYRFGPTILWSYVYLLKNNLISQDTDGSYNFLKRIRSMEIKINFNEKLIIPFNIINWFVMRENYKTAFFLLKTIYIYIRMNFSLNYIKNYYYLKIDFKKKIVKY